ncbi:alpha/beta hydrolase [Glaciibacter flavus]|uniref:Alpha/beta hydrolase n=1 Tax=Orlajensenia flava TaxID=2565934 RepID=A0A4S4FUN1_9MICO|nr:alpha/beta hydrolase [Glaciibacter flavus]THG34423.1 alpha/beta hydrolase [Glaciibacter flavus]
MSEDAMVEGAAADGASNAGAVTSTEMVRGTTGNGVPYVARRGDSPGAPVIAAWHLLDPPRSEAAFAAALPLDGLDATVIYFGLPLNGERMPAGGMDAIMQLASEDPVTRLFEPICLGAIAEFPQAFSDAREHLGVDPSAPVGLLGGSAGSAVAAGVLASGASEARAVVLVSPMLQLEPNIEQMSAFFGRGAYDWKPPAQAVATQLDFVRQAPEIDATGAAVLVVAGADDEEGFLSPARAFADASSAELRVVDGVGHALAEEPGIEPAPQTAGAAAYDAIAVAWFRDHLASNPREDRS